MIKNNTFVMEHYQDQINALEGFIKDAYPYLPTMTTHRSVLGKKSRWYF